MDFVAKHLPDKFFLVGDQRFSLKTHIFREVTAKCEYTKLPKTYEEQVDLLIEKMAQHSTCKLSN